MSGSVVLWEIGGAVLAIGVLAWILYRCPVHPARRKENRVIQACEKAFEEGEYQLVRLHLRLADPSVLDLLPWPLGPSEVPRYYTYGIEGPEPDFRGMDASDAKLVRRYLHRTPKSVPHHGRTVICTKREKEPVA
jgi:hypothetical protein